MNETSPRNFTILWYAALNTFSNGSSSPTTHIGDACGERRYSSYSSTTSALDGGEWSAPCPSSASPPVPIVQEVGWTTELVWTQRLEEKSFRLCRGSNLDCPVIQPTAKHYTDWVTPAPHIQYWKAFKFKLSRYYTFGAGVALSA
jgi:hypothetical protein